MMILTVFVQKLYKTKCETSNQQNKKKYISKGNKNFFDLPFFNLFFSKSLLPQTRPYNLGNTRKKITFMIN